MKGKVKINYNHKETTMNTIEYGSFFVYKNVLYQRIESVTTNRNIILNCVNVELGELKFINYEIRVSIVDVEIDIK